MYNSQTDPTSQRDNFKKLISVTSYEESFSDVEEIFNNTRKKVSRRDKSIQYQRLRTDLELSLDSEAPLGVTRYKLKDTVATDPIGDLIKDMTIDEISHACLHDLNFLSRFLLPQIHKYDFPPLMVTMWNMVIEGLMDLQQFVAEARYVLGIPRGFAKTTLVKLLICFATFFTENTFVLVVGSIEDNAANIIKDVKEMLNQPQVIEVFGDWKSELAINRNNLVVFKLLGKQIIFKPTGERSSTRGINLGNLRPNFIIPEDMQTEENAKSEAESGSLLTWFSSTLIPACSPDGCIYLYIGNTYAYDGSIMSALIKNPNWVSLTLGAITSEGESLWEDRHPLMKLLAAYQEAKNLNRETHWLAQMMNATDIVHDVVLDLELIDLAYKEEFLLANGQDKPKTRLVSFIVVDPASQRKTADEVAIAHVEVYTDRTLLVNELVSERMNPKKNIHVVISMALAHGTPIVLMENVAYQETLRFWFDEITEEMGIDWIHTIGFAPGKFSKNTRLLTSFEQLMEGQYFMHPTVMTEYAPQARDFRSNRTTNTDDRLDVVALSYDQYIKLNGVIHRTYLDHNSKYLATLSFRPKEPKYDSV